MSQSLHMRRNMENLSIEHETQHLTAISDNHSIQQSTEISDEEKSPANNDILSSWHSATNTLEDIEAIQCGIKKCCHMNIDTEKIMITGLRVKRKGRFSVDVIAALKNENLDNVAICNFYFDQTEGEYSLQPMYGDYEGQACFQFGNGEDCIIFHGIENALAWYQNDKDSDQYTYLIVFDWSQFPQLAGFISKFNDRYLVIDRTENTDNILRETESLSELNVIRLLHPTKNDGSWSAVKEGKFDIWRKELEEAEYGEVMEKSIDVNNDMKTDNAGECDQEQKDSPPENIDRETIDSENADEKEFPDKNGTTTMGITGIDEDLIDAESHQDFVTASTCDDESDNLDEQAIVNPDTNGAKDLDDEKSLSDENDTNDEVQKDGIPEIVPLETNAVEDADEKEATCNEGSTINDRIGDDGNPDSGDLQQTPTDLNDDEITSIGDGKEDAGDGETAESHAEAPIDVETNGDAVTENGNIDSEVQQGSEPNLTTGIGNEKDDSTDDEIAGSQAVTPVEVEIISPIDVNMDVLLREHNEIIACRDLKELEKTIKEQSPRLYIGIIKVGAALSTIKEYRLYKQHGNFINYCSSVLGISKTYGYDIVRAYEVFKNFSAIEEKTNHLELITHESHLREIAKLKDRKDQLIVFNKTVDELQGQPLTASKLTEVINRFDENTKQFSKNPIAKPQKNKRSKRILEAKNIVVNSEMISIPLSDPEVKRFFNDFIKLVSDGSSVEIQYKEAKQK